MCIYDFVSIESLCRVKYTGSSLQFVLSPVNFFFAFFIFIKHFFKVFSGIHIFIVFTHSYCCLFCMDPKCWEQWVPVVFVFVTALYCVTYSLIIIDVKGACITLF